MKKETSCSIKTSIGGQALMEGIMMRGPKRSAMAVRNPQGEMVIEEWDTEYSARNKFFKLPIIRGVFGFVDSMRSGYKCLMRSAEISGLEEMEAEERRLKEEKKLAKQAKKRGITVEELKAEMYRETVKEFEENKSDELQTENSEPKIENNEEDKKEEKVSSPMTTMIMIVSVILAVVLMIGLFVLLPTFLYEEVLERYIPAFPRDNRFLQSAFEGVLRIVLLVGYMALMALMKDIRRTFQYHGAEHKTIFCYEAGLELTVENVRKQKRFHPRCGTSFLMLMVIVSILIGFFIPPTIPKLLRMLIKILLIPVIMGVGYELIKICGKHDNWLTRAIAAPGKWFQRITVYEPDDGMIECAIAAVAKVIPDDGSDKIQ